MEEWIEMEPASTRRPKEERFLHRMLDQLDKEDEEKRIKIEKRVAKARGMMGVGREEPSIMSKIKGSQRE